MKHIWNCRRSSIGLIGMLCLTALGWEHGMDVSVAIAGIVGCIAGANAYEKSKKVE